MSCSDPILRYLESSRSTQMDPPTVTNDMNLLGQLEETAIKETKDAEPVKVEPVDTSKAKRYVVTPIGDLIVKLEVEEDIWYFTVSSQALRMASPDVWGKSLNPDSEFSCVQ